MVPYIVNIYLYIVSIFFFFLEPHPMHMDVPRLGVESELQVPAYATATAKVAPKLLLQPASQLTATPDP